MIQLEKAYKTEQLMALDSYWEAVDRMETANDTLNLLESASPAQLLKMCAEDKCQDTKMNSTNTPP